MYFLLLHLAQVLQGVNLILLFLVHILECLNLILIWLLLYIRYIKILGLLYVFCTHKRKLTYKVIGTTYEAPTLHIDRCNRVKTQGYAYTYLTHNVAGPLNLIDFGRAHTGNMAWTCGGQSVDTFEDTTRVDVL